MRGGVGERKIEEFETCSRTLLGSLRGRTRPSWIVKLIGSFQLIFDDEVVGRWLERDSGKRPHVRVFLVC